MYTSARAKPSPPGNIAGPPMVLVAAHQTHPTQAVYVAFASRMRSHHGTRLLAAVGVSAEQLERDAKRARPGLRGPDEWSLAELVELRWGDVGDASGATASSIVSVAAPGLSSRTLIELEGARCLHWDQTSSRPHGVTHGGALGIVRHVDAGELRLRATPMASSSRGQPPRNLLDRPLPKGKQEVRARAREPAGVRAFSRSPVSPAGCATMRALARP